MEPMERIERKKTNIRDAGMYHMGISEDRVWCVRKRGECPGKGENYRNTHRESKERGL